MRVHGSRMGVAGLGALRLAGGLGSVVDDTTVLQPGNIVTFGVDGGPCAVGMAPNVQAMTTALNNWISQMVTVNAVSPNLENYVPSMFSYSVTCTVNQQMAAGDLRGQIIAAMNALNSSINCATAELTNNTISIGGGGATQSGGGGGVNTTNPCTNGQTLNVSGQCACPTGQSMDALTGQCSSVPWTEVAVIGGAVAFVLVLFAMRR